MHRETAPAGESPQDHSPQQTAGGINKQYYSWPALEIYNANMQQLYTTLKQFTCTGKWHSQLVDLTSESSNNNYAYVAKINCGIGWKLPLKTTTILSWQ